MWKLVKKKSMSATVFSFGQFYPDARYAVGV